MKDSPQKGSRRFDLPPEAEKYMPWYGFIQRLPTTILWLSLGYAAGFALLTLALVMSGADLTGVRLGLYYLGVMIFVVALFFVLCRLAEQKDSVSRAIGQHVSLATNERDDVVFMSHRLLSLSAKNVRVLLFVLSLRALPSQS